MVPCSMRTSPALEKKSSEKARTNRTFEIDPDVWICMVLVGFEMPNKHTTRPATCIKLWDATCFSPTRDFVLIEGPDMFFLDPNEIRCRN